MVEWLMGLEPWRQAAVIGGACLFVVAVGVGLIRAAWRSVDPPYVGEQRRKRQADPWDVDPATGSLIVTPELEDAGRAWRDRMAAEDAHLAADHSRLIPVQRPGETRRSLAPAWRSAILSPTGSWTMPNDGRRHHHRATGSRGEETRRLHPGYVAEARARVARGEDPGELPD